jgi:hypothetical protein
MVEVCIQHIIGTAALIGLLISSGLFYTVFTSFVQDDIRKNQLGQISETVALNLEETINLIKFSKYSSDYMIKIIDLPTDVGGRGYQIQLVNDSNRLLVQTFLTTQQTVNANSTIPYNSGEIPLKLNTTDTLYHIEVGVDPLKVACSGTIYGKNDVVIWANLDWDDSTGLPYQITVGVGWVEAQQ